MTEKESVNIRNDFTAKNSFFELLSYIETIEKNSFLYEEGNFIQRADSIDFIEFQVIDQIEGLLQRTVDPENLILLKYRAGKIKSELEAIDNNLFQILRTNIQTGGDTVKGFKNLIHGYFDLTLDYQDNQIAMGYDNLDVFINGLLSFKIIPEPTKDLEQEMVYYQKTPARIVFELVEKACFTKEDVFFDVGSGMGQPAILVNLLTGIKVNGVEIDPAFCAYARVCVWELDLSNVTFINTDARKADYREGTVFFLFTPFKGEILQEVLDILKKESMLRKIKIFTYGPCTIQVALQSWLESEAPKDDNVYKLHFFYSL